MSLSLPAGSRLIASRQDVEAALDRMAAAITERVGSRELVLLTVMNGGMIPAALLALRLELPIVMDYVHAGRYHGEEGGEELNWRTRPHLDLQGRKVLVVDDILDEGPTLKAIVEHCRSLGAREVYSAVLLDKRHDRRIADARADFIGLVVEDSYLFGFGMDYRGTLRHLPGIYALPPTDD